MRNIGDNRERQVLIDRLRQLQPTTPRQWGTMSAHGMVCHLSDSFRFGLGERVVAPHTNLISRSLVKWIALYLPVRWPKGIQTRPEVDQSTGGTRPAAFEKDRADLVALMDRFAKANGTLHPPHPVFGALNDRQWLRWGWLHTDHHLRQFGL